MVEDMRFATSPLFPSDIQVEPDFYRVYGRHLHGVLNPDDRNAPRIELFSSSEDLAGVRPFTFSRLIYPRGQQNVTITAVMGYTDPDGTPFGCIPTLIRRVTQLLVLREIPRLSEMDYREEAIKRWRLVSETTSGQSYSMSAIGSLRGFFTGDPEIDTILASYVRPPNIGSV